MTAAYADIRQGVGWIARVVDGKWITPQRDLFSPLQWEEYVEIWPRSGMTRSGKLYRLPTWEHPTSGKESGLWPTPVANDDNKTPAAHMRMKANMPGGPRFKPTSLNVMVKGVEQGVWPAPLFPTPTGMGGGGSSRSGDRYGEIPTLQGMARTGLCPTPLASDTDGGPRKPNGKRGLSLRECFQLEQPMWPTPQAHDHKLGEAKRVGRFGTRHGGRNLNDEVAKWPTPCAADAERYGRGDLDARVNNSGRQKRLATPNAQSYKSPPTQECMTRRKQESSRGHALQDQIGGQLNPDWVSVLMGFPRDWLHLGDQDGKTVSPE